MKKLLNENIITDVVAKIFNAIIDDRNRSLERAQQNDPEFQKIIANVERSKKELISWVDKQLKKDPELARRYKKFGGGGANSI